MNIIPALVLILNPCSSKKWYESGPSSTSMLLGISQASVPSSKSKLVVKKLRSLAGPLMLLKRYACFFERKLRRERNSNKKVDHNCQRESEASSAIIQTRRVVVENLNTSRTRKCWGGDHPIGKEILSEDKGECGYQKLKEECRNFRSSFRKAIWKSKRNYFKQLSLHSKLWDAAYTTCPQLCSVNYNTFSATEGRRTLTNSWIRQVLWSMRLPRRSERSAAGWEIRRLQDSKQSLSAHLNRGRSVSRVLEK